MTGNETVTMGTVEESIRDYIARNILLTDDGYPYPDDTSFFDEGIVDSVGIMQLVNFVSESFRITVEDEELVLDNLGSVTRLAGYIRLKAPLEVGR
jgi:acyl carrier protein